MPVSSSASGPRRAIRVAGILVLLAVAALVAGVALTRVDAGVLRARVEAAAFHATGRRLTIAGPIHLILWPAPGFAASDVTLANIAGGSRPAMAHADEVQATIDLAALLGQRVIVRSLVLQNPDILVERAADGRPNWVFAPPVAPAPVRRPGEVLPAPAPRAHVKLTISSLDMEGGRLAWRDVPRLGDGAVAIAHLIAQQQGEANSFTLFLAGQHAGAPFTLSLAAGPPQGLAAADAAHPFPLRALLTLARGDRGDEAEPDQLGIDGQFADPLHARGFAGVVHARLRALADLEALFPHAGLPAAAAVRVTARVAEAATGDWTLSALHVETGAAEAGRLLPGLALAHLKLDAANATAAVELHAAGTLHGQDVAADAAALGNLRMWTGAGAAPDAPVDVTVRAGPTQASLQGRTARDAQGSWTLTAADRIAVPDPAALAALFGRTLKRHFAVETSGRLDLSRAATGEVSGALDADRLLLDQAAMPRTRVTADRHPDGALAVTVAEENAAPWLTWNGNVDHEPVDYTLVLDGHRVPAALVLALAGAPGRAIAGPLDLTGHLHGTATGGRIDPAHLDGTLAATLVDGTIAGAFLAPALRATHLPLGGGGEEHVRCAGFAGQVAGGVVTFASLSLDSRLLAIDGDGTIDLPAGTLSLHLRPVVRLGVAAASAPVLVRGPIAAPEATLAHDEHGRVALSFGAGTSGGAACDANPDVAALPAPKAPKAADILRSLGLFR